MLRPPRSPAHAAARLRLQAGRRRIKVLPARRPKRLGQGPRGRDRIGRRPRERQIRARRGLPLDAAYRYPKRAPTFSDARYYGRVRLLRPVHHRLRPPAFPARSRDRHPGRARRSPRFPRGRLVRMPGSLTTRSRAASRDDEAARVAFGIRHALGAPDGVCSRRSMAGLRTPLPTLRPGPRGPRRTARGAGAGRYSFIAEDSHLLPPAGLPALAWIIQCAQMARVTSGGRFHPR